jgi:uncharacterized protein (DUF1330 family)
MHTFAVARLHVTMNDEIVEYLNRIDETLAPFGGRFIVHGGTFEPLEGAWSGDLVVIEFRAARRRALGTHRAPTKAFCRFGGAIPAATSS